MHHDLYNFTEGCLGVLQEHKVPQVKAHIFLKYPFLSEDLLQAGTREVVLGNLTGKN
jgi:hypothetical protein